MSDMHDRKNDCGNHDDDVEEEEGDGQPTAILHDGVEVVGRGFEVGVRAGAECLTGVIDEFEAFDDGIDIHRANNQIEQAHAQHDQWRHLSFRHWEETAYGEHHDRNDCKNDHGDAGQDDKELDPFHR